MDYPVQLTVIPLGVEAVVFKTEKSSVLLRRDFTKLTHTAHFSYMIEDYDIIPAQTVIEVVICNDKLTLCELQHVMTDNCNDARLLNEHLKGSYLVAIDMFPMHPYINGYCELTKAERQLNLLKIVHKCKGLAAPLAYTCESDEDVDHFMTFIHDHEVTGRVVDENIHDDWFN